MALEIRDARKRRPSRCRANSAHIRHSEPDCVSGFQLNVLHTFEIVPFLLGNRRKCRPLDQEASALLRQTAYGAIRSSCTGLHPKMLPSERGSPARENDGHLAIEQFPQLLPGDPARHGKETVADTDTAGNNARAAVPSLWPPTHPGSGSGPMSPAPLSWG